jgi:RNA polymerase sigma factor (sigma-70 family)
VDPARIEELAAAAQTGDQQDFLALAEAVQPLVRATLSACAVHPEQVDELVHETLISAWRGLSTYRGPTGGGFPAWIRTIARNNLRRSLRGRRHGLALDHLDAVVIDRQLDRLEADEGVDAQGQRLLRLRSCMERLPEQVRRLVEGHHVHGQSVADLASAVSRTANWAAVALFRARKALADCVGREVGHGA